MGKVRLQLDPAIRLAEKVAMALAPGCDRIQVAGSIRRREPTVGDIEVVAIPRVNAGLFSGGVHLDGVLDELTRSERLLPGSANGEKFKQFGIPSVDGLMLDLFLVSADTWGVQLAIRTGPREFSTALVTERSRGGLLRDGLIVREGRVWNRDEVTVGFVDYRGAGGRREGAPFFNLDPGAEPYDTPEERDFMELAGGWVEPDQRRGAPGRQALKEAS